MSRQTPSAIPTSASRIAAAKAAEEARIQEKQRNRLDTYARRIIDYMHQASKTIAEVQREVNDAANSAFCRALDQEGQFITVPELVAIFELIEGAGEGEIQPGTITAKAKEIAGTNMNKVERFEAELARETAAKTQKASIAELLTEIESKTNEAIKNNPPSKLKAFMSALKGPAAQVGFGLGTVPAAVAGLGVMSTMSWFWSGAATTWMSAHLALPASVLTAMGGATVAGVVWPLAVMASSVLLGVGLHKLYQRSPRAAFIVGVVVVAGVAATIGFLAAALWPLTVAFAAGAVLAFGMSVHKTRKAAKAKVAEAGKLETLTNDLKLQFPESANVLLEAYQSAKKMLAAYQASAEPNANGVKTMTDIIEAFEGEHYEHGKRLFFAATGITGDSLDSGGSPDPGVSDASTLTSRSATPGVGTGLTSGANSPTEPLLGSRRPPSPHN